MVDEFGYAYITGDTRSTDYPTVGEYQTYQAGNDVFVTILNDAGNALEYSTYLGGSADDIGNDIAIDAGYNIYVAGHTESTDFPVQGEYQTYQDGRDGFVVKFDDRICGNANNDFVLDILDIVYLWDYLWDGGPEPQVFGTGDVDGIPGITCHDPFCLNHYIFLAVEILTCPPFRDTVLPVSTDILEFRNTIVPAGETQWDVDVWLTMDSGQVLALSLPFSFSCATSPIICDQISFASSIYGDILYSAKYGLIDAVGQKAAIGIPRQGIGTPDADSGLVATLTFSVDLSVQEQVIVIDTTTYGIGGRGDELIVIFSKAAGATPLAYLPLMPGIGPQPNVVTNLSDAGYGSLRYAMNYADTSAGTDTITFEVSGVIAVQSELPVIDGDDPVLIFGSTAPGGNYSVIVDGSALFTGNGFFINSSGNLIQGLTIRNFWENGIVVNEGTEEFNGFGDNLIYDNGGLGIDLGYDGVTENDSLDLDTGANNLMNYPVLDSAIMLPDSSFMLYGTTEGNMFVTLYVAYHADSPTHQEDPSGHGEAYEILGTVSSAPDAEFEFLVPNTIPFFSVITATGTRVAVGQSNTSEFSENFALVPAPLTIYGYSPINIMVTDPHGDRFGKYGDETFVEEISPADYFEEPDIDSVVIYQPIRGTYTIEVYGTIDAEPGTVYSMGVRIDGSTEVIIVDEDQVPLYGMPPDELEYEVEEGWHYVNGDADGSGAVDIDDAVYLIAYIFSSGPPPDPPDAGDADCSYDLDIDDVVYLIAYIFSSGPEPCAIGDE